VKRLLRDETLWSLAGYLYLVVMLLVLGFPAIIAVLTSFKSPTDIYTTPPAWLPAVFHPENYVHMFKVLPLSRAFLNSTIVASGSAVLALAASLPAGYALSRFVFPGRRLFLFFVLGSIMFSPVVIIVALYRIVAIYNLIDKYPSLILTNATFSLPFCIWLSTAYMRSVPTEIDEAASIDGANRLQGLWHVVLPMALPAPR
jgi:multiple sugar transport system permease protein